MMTQFANESSNNVAPQRSPGYLMAPFGWAAKPLAAILEADPSLYPALFSLSRRRMHLIALSLAHWQGEINASFARLLIRGVPAAVLDCVLGRRPAGLKRALNHLPVSVLPQASYQHLIELLEKPATAKLIYHLDLLGDEHIGLLHSVPAPLRRIVARAANDSLIRLEGLVDGLRFLAARGAAPSFDALIADLAAIRQPTQLIARIANLVQQLPLPDPVPPEAVGGAHRLDDTTEICRLAKRWKNCLANAYLKSVNAGCAAVYLWPHPQAPAACVVTRHGRLGWALADAKGPENADLPPAREEEIHRAFAAVGIPKDSALEPLEQADHALERLRRLQRARRHRDVEYEEIYEEFEAA
jgi:hypothetical protein